MTHKPSGTVFALMLIACLAADSAPVWLVLALVGIAGLVALIWGVAGVAKPRERRNLQKFQGSELALKMEDAVAEKAKANSVKSGEQYGKGLQKSEKPIEAVHTDETLAQMAGVSRDTIQKRKERPPRCSSIEAATQ